MAAKTKSIVSFRNVKTGAVVQYAEDYISGKEDFLIRDGWRRIEEEPEPITNSKPKKDESDLLDGVR
jgi:hypothetical protein